jgi:uncharacterized protein
VNLIRHPLRLNVGFIVSQSIGYSRDFEFEFPQIKLETDLELFNFSGTANFTRTPQGLLCQAHFKADYAMECVRCLGDAVVTLQTKFDELYAFSTRTVSESGLILPEDAHIDLEPLVHEYLTIEIPIQPICKPDCKGLCVVCGQNLNERACEHQSSPAT